MSTMGGNLPGRKTNECIYKEMKLRLETKLAYVFLNGMSMAMACNLNDIQIL